MKFPQCGACGGDVRFARRPDRMRSIRYGVKIPVPAWVPLPVCLDCGDEYMIPELSVALDALLGALDNRNSRGDVGHRWEVEKVDGGPVGSAEFWVCKVCEASGGPVWPGRTPPTMNRIFLAGSLVKPWHTTLELNSSCDIAEKQVELYHVIQTLEES